MSRSQPLRQPVESQDLVSALERYGVLPLVETVTEEDAPRVVDALCTGGLPIAEIALRSNSALKALSRAREACPEALVGAGTVRTLNDARESVAAGAAFLVSPVVNEDVIQFGVTTGVHVIPGAYTPTEVQAAVCAGASVIKFFPAEAGGGRAFLKALAGPFRDVNFLPTGGINASNIADYLRIPRVIACGGSWITSRALLRAGGLDEVERLAGEAVAIVERVRRHA